VSWRKVNCVNQEGVSLFLFLSLRELVPYGSLYRSWPLPPQ